MSLRFELQNFQSKKTGESNIRLVIQKGSKRKRIATDLKIEPEFFQNKHNRWIKSKHPQSNILNNYLTDFYSRYQKEELDQSPSFDILTIEAGFTIFREHIPRSSRKQTSKDKLCKSMDLWEEYFKRKKVWRKPVQELTKSMARGLYEELLDQGRATSTAHHRIKDLKVCFNYLCDDRELIPVNPVRHLKIKGVKKIPRETPTLDEIKSLMAARVHNEGEELARDLWMFCLYAKGIRWTDVYHLKSNDIDYNSGQIRIRTQKTNSLQVVPIVSEINDLIEKWANNGEFLFDLGQKLENYRHCDVVRSRMAKRLKAIFKRSEGKIKNITGYHSARHSFAHACQKAGIPVKDISNALGHSNSVITNGYLSRQIGDSQDDVVKKAIAFIEN